MLEKFIDELLALAAVEAHLTYLRNDAEEADDFFRMRAYEFARGEVFDRIAEIRAKAARADIAAVTSPPIVNTPPPVDCPWCKFHPRTTLSASLGTVLTCEQCGHLWTVVEAAPT